MTKDEEIEQLRERIVDLKEGNQMLSEIAHILQDFSYTGSYADGVRQLRARVDELGRIIDIKNDALWVCAAHNRLHLGGNHNTVIRAEAALAAAPQQEQEQ